MKQLCVRLVKILQLEQITVVTVQETAGGTTVGTFTILRGSVEILEKQTTGTVLLNAGTDVLGAKVGYTN